MSLHKLLTFSGLWGLREKLRCEPALSGEYRDRVNMCVETGLAPTSMGCFLPAPATQLPEGRARVCCVLDPLQHPACAWRVLTDHSASAVSWTLCGAQPVPGRHSLTTPRLLCLGPSAAPGLCLVGTH